MAGFKGLTWDSATGGRLSMVLGIGFDGQVVEQMSKRNKKRGSHLDYLMTVLKLLPDSGRKISALRLTESSSLERFS